MTSKRRALCLLIIAMGACGNNDMGSVNPAADAPLSAADAPPPGTPDAKPPIDGGTPDAMVSGGGPPTLNLCSSYTSMTGTAVTVTFTNFSYSPKCIQIKAGTMVTFSGSFSNHPLMKGIAPNQPSTPAESPNNPISNV